MTHIFEGLGCMSIRNVRTSAYYDRNVKGTYKDSVVVMIVWIYNYIGNQCLSPIQLWVRMPPMRGILDTALCDKVGQWLVAGRSFSPGTPVSSTNKTDRHDIAEILLKVALNTITLTLQTIISFGSFNFNCSFILFLFVLFARKSFSRECYTYQGLENGHICGNTATKTILFSDRVNISQ